MKQTQLNFIKEQLLRTGEISRNFCLRNYISRLGARIDNMKREGYSFDVERRDGDYVYKLKTDPTRPPQVPEQYKREIINQSALFTRAQM
ncbi:MAG: hypothetical protein WC648_01075 [Candidatus Paceibacterota bacterium]|jgi:hypothetical protein